MKLAKNNVLAALLLDYLSFGGVLRQLTNNNKKPPKLLCHNVNPSLAMTEAMASKKLM